MRSVLKSIPLLVLFGISGFGQAETYSAPVNWETYKNSKIGLSVSFPKLPVMSTRADICTQTESVSYAAYAKDVVYRLNVTFRRNEKAPKWCTNKETFSRSGLDQRIIEIRKESDPAKEEKSITSGREMIKLEDENRTSWIVDDIENGRWYEIVVLHRDNVNVDPKHFVDSVDFSAGPTGIEIGQGAPRTLGDEATSVSPVISAEELKVIRTDPKYSNSLVEFKPKASYTDAARRSNIIGSVLLRLALLANGGSVKSRSFEVCLTA